MTIDGMVGCAGHYHLGDEAAHRNAKGCEMGRRGRVPSFTCCVDRQRVVERGAKSP